MLSLSLFLATACAAWFAGAAAYVTLVEHPARMACGTRTAATVWAPSYQRATPMQASLALVACLSGLAGWWLGGGSAWLGGAILIGAVVPFTFAAIMPVNRQLLAPGRDLDAPDTLQLLQRWGRLHAVRTVLGLLASALFAWALSGGAQ